MNVAKPRGPKIDSEYWLKYEYKIKNLRTKKKGVTFHLFGD